MNYANFQQHWAEFLGVYYKVSLVSKQDLSWKVYLLHFMWSEVQQIVSYILPSSHGKVW